MGLFQCAMRKWFHSLGFHSVLNIIELTHSYSVQGREIYETFCTMQLIYESIGSETSEAGRYLSNCLTSTVLANVNLGDLDFIT